MKNLDLAAYGVAEMNRDEMKATEGGLVGLIILGVLYVGLILAHAAITGIQKGKTDGHNDAIKNKPNRTL